MIQVLQTLGWIGLVFAIAYFVVCDRMADAPADYVRNTRDILFGAMILLVASYVMKRVTPALGLGQGKCKVCGKRIEKQEMFCFDHRLQSIRDAQDRTHTMEHRR